MKRNEGVWSAQIEPRKIYQKTERNNKEIVLEYLRLSETCLSKVLKRDWGVKESKFLPHWMRLDFLRFAYCQHSKMA